MITTLRKSLTTYNLFGRGKAGLKKSKAGQPSVVLATLPKSGTDFTVNGLLNTSTLGLPEVYQDEELMAAMRTGYSVRDNRIISTGNFDTQTLSCEAMQLYVNSGHIVPTHMAASHHNLMALKEAGHRKITVIIRDPRDATVSLTYHIAKAGAELRNLHSEFQYVPENYHEWSHERQLELQVKVFLPRAINWIESWLGTQCSQYADFDIQFLHFDDLKYDSTRFLRQVAEFHELTDVRYENLTDPQHSAHFRSGQHDQWQTEFSSDMKEFSDWIIGRRLQDAYEQAVQWRLKRAIETAGTDPLSLRRNLTEIFQNFPWVESGYATLEKEFQQSDAPIPADINDEFKRYFNNDAPVMKKPWELLGKLSEVVESGDQRQT